VFQQYALFPHMTVFDNVAFGPRMLRWPNAEVRSVCERMLALVKMDHLAGRRPAQLSGGQQQRVALARALASQPKLLLLDEPLSALDLKLRQQMRVELKQLQQETGITFIFVTHDQEEALTMSDRIAVLSEGRLQQVGDPLEIYERPVNRFVADFIGETNFMEVVIESRDRDTMMCRVDGGALVAADAVGDHGVGDRVTLSLRPEKVALLGEAGQAGEDRDRLVGTVDRLIYLGTDTQYLVRLPDGSPFRARVQNAHGSARFAEGDPVALAFDPGSARILVD
jgi:spermidine/putrescine transport system ATP-binding protein